jgi:hypothetical protein
MPIGSDDINALLKRAARRYFESVEEGEVFWSNGSELVSRVNYFLSQSVKT